MKHVGVVIKVAATRTLLQALILLLLLVLLPIAPAAIAGPILAAQSAAAPDAGSVTVSPASSNAPAFLNNRDQPAGATTANAADPVDSLDRSGNGAARDSADDADDAVSAHAIAVALYYGIYDINGDIAGDLLASYRGIGRVRDDIIAAIKVPLDAIGLSNDAFTQLRDAAGAATVEDNGDRYDDTIQRNDLERIFTLLQLPFSLDFLPYDLLALGGYVLFATFRYFARRAGRAGSLHLVDTPSARDRDGAV